jgi:PPOX class probable F420-dependent enzyme
LAYNLGRVWFFRRSRLEEEWQRGSWTRNVTEWEKEFINAHRVARLATVDVQRRPHIVPVVYAFDGARLYTPVDGKPKRIGARQLVRVRNVQSNAHVSLVIDDYAEDWRQLAWVQVHGLAEIADEGPPFAAGVAELRSKYRQYEALPIALVIVVRVTHVTSWRFMI